MQKQKFKNLYFYAAFLTFGFWVLTFFGCASAPYVKPQGPGGIPGIYYRVEKGQTLWGISKMYNFDLDELARINHIADTGIIEVGQLVFIPSIPAQQVTQKVYISDDFIWPVKGRVISNFGQTRDNMINKGINIAPNGNANVVAVRSGKVIFYADNFGCFGKTLIIRHEDGLSTVYARNSQILAKLGETVQKGDVIAKVGSAGRSKDEYLHFEIRKGHMPQNPYLYLSH